MIVGFLFVCFVKLIIFKQSKNKVNFLHFIGWMRLQKQDRSRLADVIRCSPGVSSRWAEHMVTVEAAGFPEALVCLPGNYLRALGRRGGLWESHLRSARRLKDLKRLRAADEAPSSPPASFPRLLSSSVLYPWSLGVSITSCDLDVPPTDKENPSWAPEHMTLFDLLLELDPDWQRRQISGNENVFPVWPFYQNRCFFTRWTWSVFKWIQTFWFGGTRHVSSGFLTFSACV